MMAEPLPWYSSEYVRGFARPGLRWTKEPPHIQQAMVSAASSGSSRIFFLIFFGSASRPHDQFWHGALRTGRMWKNIVGPDRQIPSIVFLYISRMIKNGLMIHSTFIPTI